MLSNSLLPLPWHFSANASSLVLFCQVITLILLCMSRRWHNQRVSVGWGSDSTHTQTHTCRAVTRSRVMCFSMEVSCVSSLDYCSGCQSPHRYTSYTPSHIHTHSIASPNQALGPFPLLLLLSLWSFTGVWFFTPLLSSTSLFHNPPLPFLILCSFRPLSSHYRSLFLPHDPLFFYFLPFFLSTTGLLFSYCCFFASFLF